MFAIINPRKDTESAVKDRTKGSGSLESRNIVAEKVADAYKYGMYCLREAVFLSWVKRWAMRKFTGNQISRKIAESVNETKRWELKNNRSWYIYGLG